MKLVTCKSCGWVHFQVSRDYAVDQINKFCEYFDGLTKKEQKDFYGNTKPTIKDYESCQRCCGSHKNFADSRPEDCPEGSTMGPIINRDE